MYSPIMQSYYIFKIKDQGFGCKNQGSGTKGLKKSGIWEWGSEKIREEGAVKRSGIRDEGAEKIRDLGGSQPCCPPHNTTYDYGNLSRFSRTPIYKVFQKWKL